MKKGIRHVEQRAGGGHLMSWSPKQRAVPVGSKLMFAALLIVLLHRSQIAAAVKQNVLFQNLTDAELEVWTLPQLCCRRTLTAYRLCLSVTIVLRYDLPVCCCRLSSVPWVGSRSRLVHLSSNRVIVGASWPHWLDGPLMLCVCMPAGDSGDVLYVLHSGICECHVTPANGRLPHVQCLDRLVPIDVTLAMTIDDR